MIVYLDGIPYVGQVLVDVGVVGTGLLQRLHDLLQLGPDPPALGGVGVGVEALGDARVILVVVVVRIIDAGGLLQTQTNGSNIQHLNFTTSIERVLKSRKKL